MSDYQIIASDRTVEGWYDGNEPQVSGGYGGWQTDPRPQRISLTRWAGREPFQITLPMLLSDRGRSVEDSIHDLEVIGSANDAATPPRLVRPDGMVVLPTHAGGDWVINDLGWGDRKRNGDGIVTRQQVTVTLLEHVTDLVLGASTAASRAGGRPVVRFYIVKKGDTLRSIAAHELFDPKRWGDIAVLNGLRSSGQLKVGMKLKIPTNGYVPPSPAPSSRGATATQVSSRFVP